MPQLLPSSHLRRFFVSAVVGCLVASTASAHKVRVDNPALAKEISTSGGKLIANYGSFQLFETDSAKGEIHDEFDTITLNAGHLDTKKPEIKALKKSAGNFAGKRMHLIHFAGPIKPEWRKDLETAGVKIITYIPNNAYLVYGDAKAIGKIQSYATTARHVQWDGQYADAYKLHPAAQTNSANAVAIQLVADAEANAATLALINQWKLEPIKQKYSILNYLNIVVRLAPDKLALLAAQPDVISIQPAIEPKKNCERQAQIVAGNLSGNVPSGPGYLAWLASKGFTQAQFTTSGFLVDVSDFGIDNGTTAPNHFALYPLGNTNNTSRVAYNRLEGTTSFGTALTGCDGHGTLNAHVIGGYDDQSGFPHTDGAGYHYGLGICPFVGIGSSVIFEQPAYFTSPNYPNLESEAYHDGARINNNSWGAAGSGIYDITAQTYDALVRNAQPAGSTYATNHNQEMVIVFVSGNEGPSPQTIEQPGSAKNVITVGASENVQAIGGNDGCGFPDSEADSANDVWSVSSRGPCADGRHKPDLVAPGTHISGGLIQAASPGPNGTADGCFDASAICGGVANNFFPAGQQFFTLSSGTSQAAPCVSGGCALVRQYFINNFTYPPSPAMTKAYLMNAARYLTGAGANDSLWSDHQGMGEMNLGAAFDGTPRLLRDQLPQDIFTATGQSHTYVGTISDTNKPFRVTVAWTDAPGNTTGNAYNNDLDLTVTVGGNVYKGNVFQGAYSITGGNADSQNNAESVFLPAGTSGNFTVKITAANINSDGVPNNTNALDQDFAIVIDNAISGAAPILAAGTALLNETDSPTNGVIDPGETVTVNFSLANIGAANTTNLVATVQSSTSVIAPSGPQIYGALTAGGATVTQPFTFTANGICGKTFTATLQLQDGQANLGTVTFNIPLGQTATNTVFTQNFDGVSTPSLPAGWSTTTSGAQSAWVSSSSSYDTPSHAAFASEAGNVGVSELISPSIAINSTNAQLTFRHKYNLEVFNATYGYDGGVLEISIGGGAYSDILNAGGTFQTGDYNRIISPSDGSPIAGRRAWSGNSLTFVTTIVALPASAAGQNVQFKWRCATDRSTGGSGWYVDTISVTDGSNPSCAKILVPPQISDIHASGSDITIKFLSIGGLSYNLEYKENLNLTNWIPLLPATTGTADLLTLHATNVTSTNRFYRIHGQ